MMKSWLPLCVGAAVLGLSGPLAGQDGGKGVAIKPGKDAIEFYAGGELVTRYHVGNAHPKPIFWPVNAPGGVPLTRAWPMDQEARGQSTDHIHHRSAWFVYGDVIPEGITLKQKIKGVDGVDFWSEAKGHGRIVCTRVEEPKSEGGHATLGTHNEWRTADGEKILDESRTIRLYDLGKARLIVVDIGLHASVAPITFGDTKEGAFAVRINDQINAAKGKGKIVNAEGKTGEKGAWGQFSAWCDYSGPIDGKEVGLAILADPKNPHPTAWHVRGYGLMAANPFGRTKTLFPATRGKTDLVKLGKGDRLHFRYGMLLHTGDAEAGRVAEHYRRFVELRGKE